MTVRGLLQGWAALAATGVTALAAAGAAVLHARGPTPAAARVPACLPPLGGDHVLDRPVSLRLHVPRVPPPPGGRRPMLIVQPRPGADALATEHASPRLVALAHRHGFAIAFLDRPAGAAQLHAVRRTLTGPGVCAGAARVALPPAGSPAT